jgi:hypothetical protein
MKPIFYIVFSRGDSYRFATRTMARAFAAACKLAGYPAIIKSIL